MQLHTATRTKILMKMALQGPSGSGKTYSALLLAYGLWGDWSKIGVIDTENSSAHLYSSLGNFLVLGISAPYSPEKYMEAIGICEHSGMEVIIIDSITPEWDGIGGILEIHSNMAGNSFTNWRKLTPRHNSFIQAILQSSCHIICSIRTKQDYVLTERSGKMVPEKVGLRAIQREGIDYEFTIVLNLDIKHYASPSKDRTALFAGTPFIISPETGQRISLWCNPMPGANGFRDIKQRINECKSFDELLGLYNALESGEKAALNPAFSEKRKSLSISHPVAVANVAAVAKTTQNGTTNHQ